MLNYCKSTSISKNLRYIETDLNRTYGQNNHDTLENRRSNIIKPIIDQCDYIIDIHQCIEDTLNPFFILPYSEESHQWIISTAPNIPVIKKLNITQASTLSTYGYLEGKMAVTFEVGSHGVDVYQLEVGIHTTQSFLNFAWSNHRHPQAIRPEQHTASTYDIQHFQPYTGGEVKFEKNFKNFESIHKNQVIAYVNGIAISSPITGKVLLYPQKWFVKNSTVQPDGLFIVIQTSA